MGGLLALFMASGGDLRAAGADKRPLINILSLENDLEACVSTQIEAKIDEVRPIRDLSLNIRRPHLQLVMFCEAINVNLSNKDGEMSTVPITACASVLAENPGVDMINNLPKSAVSLKKTLTGMTRQLRVIVFTGQMGQQCRTIVNQVTPPIFQWLLHRGRSK